LFDIVYPPGGGTKLRGEWEMELRGPDGKIKQVVRGTNVVCTNGKAWLTSFLASASLAPTTFTAIYIGIGSGTTPETASDTGLVSELARQTGVASPVTGGIYQVVATFATGSGTGAITEYGLFNSNSAGTMLARDTETVINKGASDTLTVTAQITFS
jgi:hypothetical protein